MPRPASSESICARARFRNVHKKPKIEIYYSIQFCDSRYFSYTLLEKLTFKAIWQRLIFTFNSIFHRPAFVRSDSKSRPAFLLLCRGRRRCRLRRHSNKLASRKTESNTHYIPENSESTWVLTARDPPQCFESFDKVQRPRSSLFRPH
jgi:hypothetical protein